MIDWQNINLDKKEENDNKRKISLSTEVTKDDVRVNSQVKN